MKDFILQLIESAVLGYQDAERKVMDYLLLKGSYIQPLRIALGISNENSGASLFNTLTPYLLEGQYLFDLNKSTHQIQENTSGSMSTGVVSSNLVETKTTTSLGESQLPGSDSTEFGEQQHQETSHSEQPETSLKEAEITELNPDSDMEQLDTRENKKKEKKRKKKKIHFDPVEYTPYTIWLQEKKSLRDISTKNKNKKSNKYKQVQESALKSVMPSQEIISEPLARILVNQGHYIEAKKMFKSLILKFPEMAEVFERDIQEINNRIESSR